MVQYLWSFATYLWMNNSTYLPTYNHINNIAFVCFLAFKFQIVKIWYIQLYCPYIVQNFWSDLDNAQKPKNSKHNVESSSFLSKVFRSWIVSTILQPMTKSWCQNSWIPSIRIKVQLIWFCLMSSKSQNLLDILA